MFMLIMYWGQCGVVANQSYIEDSNKKREREGNLNYCINQPFLCMHDFTLI